MRKIFLIIFLFSIVMIAQSQNHMEYGYVMGGEHGGSHFGWATATLDANGDGYDDLIVSSNGWSPDSVYNQNWGSVYFYKGGPDFDSIPEIFISGKYHSCSLGEFVYSMGDLNGDGCDDFGIYSRQAHPYSDHMLKIYYGAEDVFTSFDTVPEFYLEYDNEDYYYMYLEQPGDINNDGYSDNIVSLVTNSSHLHTPSPFYILWGGPDSLSMEYFGAWGTYYNSHTLGCIVGDVNNDSYDDFTISYADTFISRPPHWEQKTRLYFGGEVLDTSNYILVVDSNFVTQYTQPFGDLNRDGYDDFLGAHNQYGSRIWYGGETITSEWNLTIPETIAKAKYGDFNNDGYDDIVGAQPTYHAYNGIVRVYLGGEHPNNSSDLEIEDPGGLAFSWAFFGLCLSTGDYDGDGFDDIAVSAPKSSGLEEHHLGYVCIYLGNDSLVETTPEAIEGEYELIKKKDKSFLKAYPNPFNPTSTISFSLQTETRCNLSIYNIKGQLVRTLLDTEMERGRHSVLWNGENDVGDAVASGIYMYRLSIGDETITKRILLLK